MSTAAIVMMSLAILLVWGGLALSAVHLLRHPDHSSGDLALGDRLAPAAWERED
ncbi:methionine/alanine import family NSS transporter small subunit, partial [Micrococcus endophyticus]